MNEPRVGLLLVDDDDDDVFYISELLSEIKDLSIEIEVARTFDHARELFDANRHDVYLLDYRLGGRTGLDLLREAMPSGPVIMLTGQQDDGTDLEALKHGAADYLVKDRLSADALNRAVRYAIERRSFQRLLEQSQEKLNLALRFSGIGTWSVDLASGAVEWDEHMALLFGIDQAHRPRTLAESLEFMVEEDRARFEADLVQAVSIQGPFETEFRTTRRRGANGKYDSTHEGDVLYFATRGNVVSNGTSPSNKLTGACWDVTERRRGEEQRKLLLAELDHRVKNTLALVLAIARQTMKQPLSVDALISSFEGRLRALADMHGLLTQSKWKGVSLQEMVQLSIKPYCGDERSSVNICGPELTVPPSTAQLFYLIMHELSSNAAKYGSLSVANGSLNVEWGIDGDELQFSWREGGGPAVEPPSSRGFGSKLIDQTVKYELGGTVLHTFDPNGVACTITVPLATSHWRQTPEPSTTPPIR